MKTYRLIVLTCIATGLFILNAVSLTHEFIPFYWSKETISIADITHEIHRLYKLVMPIFAMAMLTGIYFTITTKHKFWLLFWEDFFFGFILAALMCSLTLYILDTFFSYNFKLSVDLIAGGAACTLCLALSTYREIKITYQE